MVGPIVARKDRTKMMQMQASAIRNAERLVTKADALGNVIRIDMEESRWVDATLRIYRRLRETGHDSAGTVLQTCLFRTEQDLKSLLDLRPNLRLVKGAYLEPETIAYPAKSDVDRAYARLVEKMLPVCSYLAVATQDESLIKHARDLAERARIVLDRIGFQMLCGVHPRLRLDLARKGFSALVARPTGPSGTPI
jgi:proline dehydrogenase